MKDYQELLGDKARRPYLEFLASKKKIASATGFDVSREEILQVATWQNEKTGKTERAFPFQVEAIRWAIWLGKAALFESVGLGKTIQQLVWAHFVSVYTKKPVIIFAPLAVNFQTIREAKKKLNLVVPYAESGADIRDNGIYITNYERLEKFDCSIFGGVVLDEGSILKSFSGIMKNALERAFLNIPFKLVCTATPSPNDHMELGNYAQFLDVMSSSEMLANWFANDLGKSGHYYIIPHAARHFWEWLTSWALCLTKPRDMGKDYDMQGYDLPSLNIHYEWVGTADETRKRAWEKGQLVTTSVSVKDINKVKRESLALRLERIQSLVEDLSANEAIAIWCSQNIESETLYKAFKHLDAVEIQGKETPKTKEDRLLAFTEGRARIMITKPKIAGMGLNWQHCAYPFFFSPSFSFESEYQALGRFHRFGQEREVHAYMIVSESESNIVEIVARKRAEFEVMQENMTAATLEHGLFRDPKKSLVSSLGNTEIILPTWLITKD